MRGEYPGVTKVRDGHLVHYRRGVSGGHQGKGLVIRYTIGGEYPGVTKVRDWSLGTL